MTLLERLRREARKLDFRVNKSLPDMYDQKAADLRDLLEEAAAVIQSQSSADTMYSDIVMSLRTARELGHNV